ncbi:MAG: hypothetical protein ACLGH3_01070 [Actinomycetota bacterium]
MLVGDLPAVSSLALGDLDGDGIDEVLLLRQSRNSHQAGIAATVLEAGVVYPADAAEPIKSTFTLDSRIPAGTAPLTVARAGIYARDDQRCYLLAINHLEPLLRLSCGIDGPEWERTSVASRGLTTADEANAALAGTEIAIPLDVADIDRDGVSEILVGNYSGAGTPTGASAWTMRLEMLDAATGDVEKSWITTSIGLAPSASFSLLDRNQGPSVSVASGAPDGDGFTVQVANYYPQSPFAVQYPVSIWTTQMPRPANPVGLRIEALPGTGWPEGGVAVSLIADDRPTRGLRAALQGPSAIVGLGRGGLERFRVELPSASSLDMLRLDADGIIDIRTVRVDLDSLVVETWSGAGTSAKLGEHRMTFLEGDDYAKTVRVFRERDLDGDGISELSIAGGFPCGPRMQVVSETSLLWEIPESRSLFCDHGLTTAGPIVDEPGQLERREGLLEWRTLWTCCLTGASPFATEFSLRDGVDGNLGWTTQIPEWKRITGAEGHVVGDTNGDRVSEPLVVTHRWRASATLLDGATGELIWLAEL